jgi:hypothetical protein
LRKRRAERDWLRPRLSVLDWYETNPNGNEGIPNVLGIPGLLGLHNIVGKYLNSNAQHNGEDDYYDPNNNDSKWHYVAHLNILSRQFLEEQVLITLTGQYIPIQTGHTIL